MALVESLDDEILIDINDCLGQAVRIRDAELPKWRGVHASVRLCCGRQSLRHRHRLQIDDADLVFAPIRRVYLLQARNILQPSDPGNAGYCLDRLRVDDIEDSRAEMGRK